MKLDHVIAHLALTLSAIIHLYFGAAFALDPVPWMQNLHLAASNPAGVAEMRAFYGGLMLSLGALFVVAVAVRSALYPGLVLMTVTYLGAALVRSVSLAANPVDDPPAPPDPRDRARRGAGRDVLPVAAGALSATEIPGNA